MYRSYVLEGLNVPVLADFYLHICTVPQKELADILNASLDQESLPMEIRIIRQNVEKNSWEVFFKYD